jgi:hypothetical protein
MTEWKKFLGSDEQISEILNAKDGFKWLNQGIESDVLFASNSFEWRSLFTDIAASLDNVEYLILNPHPHADMIIEWARTGREVYYYHEGMGIWELDDEPTWSQRIKYSFNPDGL